MLEKETLEKVKKVLIDSLRIEEDEIKMDSQLQKDLGAESMHFIDINFRLERMFKIAIPFNIFWPVYGFQYNPACIQDGKLTQTATQKLREQWPWAAVPDALALSDVSSLFTVNWIVLLVKHKLNDRS